MEDITHIDFKKATGKLVCVNEKTAHKQKVFFTQNGIGYGLDGKAVDDKQVKAYYAKVAADAQKVADEAAAKAKELAEEAAAVAKAGGVTKTQARNAGS